VPVISKNNTYSISIRNLSKYIYNSANVGVMVFDNHLQLVTLNVYAQKLIGLEEPFGKYAWELMCEDEASFNDLYARAVKGEEFKKKGAVPIDDGIPDNHQEIVTIYKEGEISVGNIDRMETNWEHYYQLFEKVMSMADYYGRELPYANDWFINMQIYYSIAFQRELGLR